MEMILNHDKQRYMIDEWDNLLNKISEATKKAADPTTKFLQRKRSVWKKT